MVKEERNEFKVKLTRGEGMQEVELNELKWRMIDAVAGEVVL